MRRLATCLRHGHACICRPGPRQASATAAALTRCAPPQSGRGPRRPAPAPRLPHPWSAGGWAGREAQPVLGAMRLPLAHAPPCGDASPCSAAPSHPLSLPRNATKRTHTHARTHAHTLRLSQKEKTGSGTRPCATMFWKGGVTLPTEISGKPMPCTEREGEGRGGEGDGARARAQRHARTVRSRVLPSDLRTTWRARQPTMIPSKRAAMKARLGSAVASANTWSVTCMGVRVQHAAG